MNRPVSGLRPPDRKKTKRVVREAVSELKHAARPRSRSVGDSLSWLVALAAGAAVAVRGFTAAKEADTHEIYDVPPLGLPAGQKAFVPAASSASIAPSAAMNDGAETENAAPIQGFGGLAKEFYARFNADEIMTRSYALAFILVLSLVPLLLFALAIAGFLIHSPQQAEDFVRHLVGSLLPGQQAGQAANEFIQQTHIGASAQTLMNGKWYAVVGGFLSLLWAAIGLFVSASDPMNKAWDVTETRSFVKLRVVSLCVFAGALTFFALSLFVTSGAHGALTKLGIPNDLPPVAAFVVDLLFFALAVVINAGMYALIYKFLPNAEVTWKSALFSGVVIGFLGELFKQGFAVYLAHFGDFNKLYGAFGSIFLLVTWISYSCIILLSGAIVGKMYHEHSEGGVQKKIR